MEEMEKKQKARYTKGEEIFNGVTHIVGAVFGLVVLIVGVVFASLYGDAYAIVAMVIYGLSMIILYTASSIYHFLRPNRAKRLFRIFDHCTIFLLIAGTYTPYCLIALRESGAWGWTLFGVIWGFAILGIIFNAVNMHNKIIKRLSMIAYIAMGWCAVIAIVPIVKVLPWAGLGLLVGGGVVYTIGAVLYVIGKRKKYMHSVWHIFVLLGSILHFFSILFFVIL
jgi:hemolysin III